MSDTLQDLLGQIPCGADNDGCPECLDRNGAGSESAVELASNRAEQTKCARCDGEGTVLVKVYTALSAYLKPALCGFCGGNGTITERTK